MGANPSHSTIRPSITGWDGDNRQALDYRGPATDVDEQPASGCCRETR